MMSRPQEEERLKHGIFEIHAGSEKADQRVNIVVVPGFATNPETCWQWGKTSSGSPSSKTRKEAKEKSAPPGSSSTLETEMPPFNWILDEYGLSESIPEARILLYAYASAWKGSKSVDNHLGNIGQELCDALKDELEGTAEGHQPIIFIGHSMGGLVIADALAKLDAQRDRYAGILSCVTSCVFFGTPFRGTTVAQWGVLWTEITKRVGLNTSSSLMKLMQPMPNEYLRNICSSFETVALRTPAIELHCFFEMLDADVGESARGVLPESVTQYISSKAKVRFVSEDSATAILPGSSGKKFGLYTNHSNLVKFQNPDCKEYKTVLRVLKEFVRSAPEVVKKRQTASRTAGMHPQIVDDLRQRLRSSRPNQLESIYMDLEQPSWFLKEMDYRKWELLSVRGTACLLLTGKPGEGKTSIALSAFSRIRRSNGEKASKSSKQVPLLAAFMCNSTPAGSSALELLKSILLQLINQNGLVANHAKHLSACYQRNSYGYDSVPAGSVNATQTLYNLWSCLRDILCDDAFRDIYIIINNIHLLDHSEETTRLVQMIRDHLLAATDAKERVDQGPPLEARRWMFTCADSYSDGRFKPLNINGCTTMKSLSDPVYKDKIGISRRKEVESKVKELQQDREYSHEQVYLIQDHLNNRVSNEQWVDIQYIRLKSLENGASTEAIRKVLDAPKALSLRQLVHVCWRTIFKIDERDSHCLKEMLWALALAFRPLSTDELSQLSDIREQTKVRELLDRCRPLIHEVSLSQETPRFSFSNPSFRNEFLWEFSPSLEPGEVAEPLIARHHGMLVWRCFSYMEINQNVPLDSRQGVETLEPPEGTGIGAQTSTSAVSYQWEFWMNHALCGDSELAEYLVRQLGFFWDERSSLREKWLRLNPPTTRPGTLISCQNMTALHVACVFGYDKLVYELMRRGHEPELKKFNADGYSPLHIAALFNHIPTLNRLLNNTTTSFDINQSQDKTGTALHAAAIEGRIDAMKLLLAGGANPNAFCEDHGPVINAAIKSGNNDAVQLLLSRSDHDLDSDGAQKRPSLALAAESCDEEVFALILLGGEGKWKQKHYKTALDNACGLGKLDSIKVLLQTAGKHFDQETLRECMLTAAYENKWECVAEMAKVHCQVPDQRIFYLAAANGRDGKTLPILRDMWTNVRTSISEAVVHAALYQATDNEHLATVRWLLEVCGAEPSKALDNFRESGILPSKCLMYDGSDKRFGDAITAAAWDGSKEIVELLLEHKAEVDSRHGCALQMAAKQGKADVVRVLLEAGAETDRIPGEEPSYRGPRFSDGTALHAACYEGHSDVVKVLLECKKPANVNLGRGFFQKPILTTTQRNWPEILSQLLAAGVEIEVSEGAKSTPLINAAFNMSAEAAKSLIGAGADVNRPNAAGDTAIILAAQKGKADTLQLLIDSKAELLHESPRGDFALTAAANRGYVECTKILSTAIAPIFRALNKVASKNSTMTELLARPEGDHVFWDEKNVRPLQAELRKANETLERTEQIRIDWKKMEDKVRSSQIEAEKCRKEADATRLKEQQYRTKTDAKQIGYDAAIAGFDTKKNEVEELNNKNRACWEENKKLEEQNRKLTDEISELKERINLLLLMQREANQSKPMLGTSDSRGSMNPEGSRPTPSDSGSSRRDKNRTLFKRR